MSVDAIFTCAVSGSVYPQTTALSVVFIPFMKCFLSRSLKGTKALFRLVLDESKSPNLLEVYDMFLSDKIICFSLYLVHECII